MTAWRVNPINPLLEPDKIAGILRQMGARVVVTLKPFPKTDLAQKVAATVALAPDVQHLLEVDLRGYLTARVAGVIEDPRRGLVARIDAPQAEAEALTRILGDYAVPWDHV